MPRYNANILIKELRNAQGLTQEQLAEGICSRHTITKIESGERKADWFILQWTATPPLALKQVKRKMAIRFIPVNTTERLLNSGLAVICTRNPCKASWEAG